MDLQVLRAAEIIPYLAADLMLETRQSLCFRDIPETTRPHTNFTNTQVPKTTSLEPAEVQSAVSTWEGLISRLTLLFLCLSSLYATLRSFDDGSVYYVISVCLFSFNISTLQMVR